MSVCSSVCLHACATNCAHSSFSLYCVRLRHAVQVCSFSVQVRLAPVPSARHPRIDPSARTPLDVGLLGLAPSDRPLSAQSLSSCCTLLHPAALCCTLLCLLSRSRAWHSTLGRVPLSARTILAAHSFMHALTDTFIHFILSFMPQ